MLDATGKHGVATIKGSAAATSHQTGYSTSVWELAETGMRNSIGAVEREGRDVAQSTLDAVTWERENSLRPDNREAPREGRCGLGVEGHWIRHSSHSGHVSPNGRERDSGRHLDRGGVTTVKRSALALCAGLLLLGILPGSALAIAPVPDQNATNNGTWISFGGSMNDIEQTFVVGVTGTLAQVDVELKVPSLATVRLAIRTTNSGWPTGTYLSIPSLSVSSTSGAVYHFVISNPPSVKQGDELAFQLDTTVAGCYALGSNSSTYAWGELFSGNPMAENATKDLGFETWVNAATPSLAPPIQKTPSPAPVATPTPATAAQATPTPAPTPAPTAKPTPTPVVTASPSPSESATATPSPTATPTATEAASVAGLVAGLATPSSAPVAGATTGSGGSGSPLPIIAAVIVLLALAAGGAWFVLMRQRGAAGSPRLDSTPPVAPPPVPVAVVPAAAVPAAAAPAVVAPAAAPGPPVATAPAAEPPVDPAHFNVPIIGE